MGRTQIQDSSQVLLEHRVCRLLISTSAKTESCESSNLFSNEESSFLGVSNKKPSGVFKPSVRHTQNQSADSDR